MPVMPARIMHTTIEREWQAVYAFASNPENLPRWASGLASGVRREGADWVANGILGKVRLHFVPDNPYGLIDHDVTLPGGETVSNPLRILQNGDGAEVMFTLFRQEGMSDAAFEADAASVDKDLARLKEILEAESGAGDEMRAPPTRIDYVEINVADIARAKEFYGGAFGWQFTDYGPQYCEFSDGRLKGGFTTLSPVGAGGPLVILFSERLEETKARVAASGGRIVQPITAFPGGRRFHFKDPDGYELAVWSDR